MKAFVKYTIVLASGLAAGFCLRDESSLRKFVRPSIDEIRIFATDALASVRPEAIVTAVDPAAAARVDEELDYRIAQRAKSLEGWRGFLAAHGGGLFADDAKAEIDKLLGAQNAEAKTPDVAPDATLAEAPKSWSAALRNADAPHVQIPPDALQSASFCLEDCERGGEGSPGLSDRVAKDQTAASAGEWRRQPSRPATGPVGRSEPAPAALTVAETSNAAPDEPASEGPDRLSAAALEAKAAAPPHDETVANGVSDFAPTPSAAWPIPPVKAPSPQKQRAVPRSNKVPVSESSKSRPASLSASHCSGVACHGHYALPLIVMALLGEKPRRSGSFDGAHATRKTISGPRR